MNDNFIKLIYEQLETVAKKCAFYEDWKTKIRIAECEKDIEIYEEYCGFWLKSWFVNGSYIDCEIGILEMGDPQPIEIHIPIKWLDKDSDYEDFYKEEIERLKFVYKEKRRRIYKKLKEEFENEDKDLL